MQLTYYGANTWFFELGDRRILVDPWLVDSLVFGNQRWFFEGKRRQALEPPARIDAILLSQGLPDHAHEPTLRQLDKTIPVIASASAARLARKLGYAQVIELRHGQTTTLAEGVEIHALPGGPIGPMNRENAFVLQARASGRTLYYEPHGYPPAEARPFAPVDAAISPTVNLELPLAGPIIRGEASAPQLVQWLRPQYLLPTAAGGDIDYSGAIAALLRTRGSLEALRSWLAQQGFSTQVLEPQPGEPVALAASSQAAASGL